MMQVITNRDWQTVSFGDVVKLNTDRSPDPAADGIERYVGLEHIEPEDLRIRRWGLVADGTTFTNHFQPGQVLFGKRRAYLRKVAVADFEGVCSSDIYVFEPKSDRLLPELLPFLCQTEAFYEHAVGTSAGSLSPRTNWTQLANFEFALPPVEEQRRITALLRSVEAQSTAQENCITAANNLLLSVSANLTMMNHMDERHWKHIDLPNDWQVKKIGQLCTLGGGYGFRPKDWSETGFPIIRIQNLNGSPDFNYYAEEPLKEWIVEPGELLFAWAGMPGVSFGPCLWSGPVGVLNQHIYRVHPNENISKIWLYYVLKLLTPWIERRAHGFKKSLLHIRRVELTDRLVPVPPYETQCHIAGILQQCEDTLTQLETRLVNSKSIKQRILNSRIMNAPLYPKEV